MLRNRLYLILCTAFLTGLGLAACSDDLLEPEPLAAPTATDVAETPLNPFNVALGTGACMGNDAVSSGGLVSGFGTDPLAFNCTAGDIVIANAETASGQPIQCVAGQPIMDVDIVADIVQNSESDRVDIGIWIESLDNMAGGAEDGACDFFYFDGADVAGSSATNEDGDQCGDLVSKATVTDFELGGLDLICPTNPIIVDGQTFIEIESCISWTQPGGDRVCPVGSSPFDPIDYRHGTLPANKSKCECDAFLVPVEIQAQLTLTKNVVNNDGGTAVDTDWTLAFSGPDNGSGVEGAAAVTNAAVAAGTYTLSESGGPANYSSDGVWSCTGEGTFTSPNQIALGSGDIASCEITNTDDPISLTLTKNVVNNDGGTAVDTDWTLAFSGPDNGSGVEGASAVTNAAVDAGTYTLSESGGPAGYMSDGVWSCTGDGTFTSPNQIALGLGDSASCEITNTDNPISLTLTKNVVNNDGGTAVDTDWTLAFSGPDNGSGVEGAAAVTNAMVDAGTYTLSESGGPAGYSSTGVWSCTGGGTFTSPNQIALALGDNASCEITNTDDPISLTLTKNVINNDGGTAVDTDWTLAFSGPDNGSGVEGAAAVTNAAVDAGTYTLSESGGPAGYSSTGVWSCTGDGTFTSPNQIALGLGDTASCEITNTDDPISLTLTKNVINNDGGTAVDTDWTLAFSGPDNGSGVEGAAAVTNAAVDAGTYTLSESGGPAGYSSTGVWSCTGDGTFTSPNQIALGLGDTASCEITNTDDPISLTLTKNVINDNGGTAVDTDWTLAFSGPDNGSGVEGAAAVTNAAVDAGTYTLSESGGPAAYSSTGVWSCTGDGTFTSPNQIALGLGDTASCEITNDDIPQECEAGDRLTSVSLQLTANSPNPITVVVSDDNGKNPTPLSSSPGSINTGDSFTVVPDGGTFFDSQNLRFMLNGEVSKNLKVHLSCSDDPAVGDTHSGNAGSASVTLQKTGFVATQFN